MARNIRVRAIRRRDLDEDKLALAFLMLAKVIAEQTDDATSPAEADVEAV
jgi:hypothetical protein